MLDWSSNPLIGLYFAIAENDGSEDGSLYAYFHPHPPISVLMQPDPFAIHKIELFRPPHLSERIAVQASVFTAEPPRPRPRKGGDVLLYTVSASAVRRIQVELAQLGISEATIWPGLDGLARELASRTW